MAQRYRNIFFDLDDTLWDFTGNSRLVYRMMYERHGYSRFFKSFDHYLALYERRNEELWADYGRGLVTKDELNVMRFTYPFEHDGIGGCRDLALSFMRDSLAMMPTMRGVVDGAHEVLDCLAPRYNLYILSNGFRELQSAKLASAGLEHYFSRVILSEDIQVHKPRIEIFNFALSATQSLAAESLMVGDNIDTDIKGAAAAGLDQVWFNRWGNDAGSFRPTFEVRRLEQLLSLL